MQSPSFSGESNSEHVIRMHSLQVARLTYSGTWVTHWNDIHAEINADLNLGNACDYSVQNIFIFTLPIYKPKD
jgi:hypothetical protein